MACSSCAGAGASRGGSGFRVGSSLGSLPRLRKRRRVGPGREPLDEALVRFLSSQRAVEERFLALEECRLQWEAEAEQRRAQMEQRRAEMERQHEFRMFSVFTHMVSALRPDLSPPPLSRRGRAREEEEEEGRGGLYPRPSNDPPRASPYLSSRGNRIRNFETTLQEGYTMYHADKHDEDKNPSGIINLGTSENKLCFDLLSKRVLVVNGCGSLFSSLAAVLCDPEDGILIPTPFYGVITGDVLLYSSVRLVHVHLDSQMSGSDERPFQLTVEKLEKGLEDAKQEGISVRVMILINPHNPLGEIYTPTEMKEFLEFAKRHELHAIVDEVYMLSVFDESATFHSVLSFNKIPDPQRTHVMWGISKDFAASGLRVGTLYSENKHVIDALGQMAYFHGVPGTTQHQVAHLLQDRDWINQMYLQTNRARLKASLQYITSELNSLNIPYLDRPAGFYIWADFRKFLREETFEEEIALWRQFLNNKVLLSCGKAFECSKPGWFRIIFTDKTYRLQLGMQRLREVLDDRNLDNQLDGLKKSSQSEEKTKPSPSEDKKKPSQSEERRSLGKSDDKKTAVHSGPDHALDCSNDDIVEDALQSAPSAGGLDSLIGVLRKQIRSSDWLERNTPELFAHENPEVFEPMHYQEPVLQPLTEDEKQMEREVQVYIDLIQEKLPTSKSKLKHIQESQQQDDTCQRLVQLSQLNHRWPTASNFQRKDSVLKKQQVEHYNKRYLTAQQPALRSSQRVWISDSKSPGTVINRAETPSSYVVKTSLGEVRRHISEFFQRRQKSIKVTQNPKQQGQACEEGNIMT
ncbi:1-aminocyclopropane-1-carboxylate synthase-like protein 1 [Acipenser ruthenus]|uniref:1-aminocyclopropane-1-carboxylate synthase-like protein 1 n=1 Tax=Acipenser ruthenus TaxID=7906 RepID=A0A662YTD1_ACIRT|nr:1-aminocyclopropane-1-carboxylate synthase-like protein 1 [Acipenser ruthenus]